jgi:putative endonuclease
MTTTARQRQSLGAYGERVAARYLTDLGMTVLDRNWRCPTGEIDLVLREGSTLVVCEVRTRRNLDYGHPLATVHAPKVRRLHALAELWMEAHDVVAREIRLDLVGVLAPRRGPAQVEHVRGIG